MVGVGQGTDLLGVRARRRLPCSGRHLWRSIAWERGDSLGFRIRLLHGKSHGPPSYGHTVAEAFGRVSRRGVRLILLWATAIPVERVRRVSAAGADLRTPFVRMSPGLRQVLRKLL